MKAFWSNLFYDMEECGLTNDEASFQAGLSIRDDLRTIEDAIRKYDGAKALTIIEELKQRY